LPFAIFCFGQIKRCLVKLGKSILFICARFTYGFVLTRYKKDGLIGTVFVVFFISFHSFRGIPPSAFRRFSYFFKSFISASKVSSARQIQPFSCRTLSFVVP
jgi:hypothetical protein